MDRDAIVRELELLSDATYVYQSNLVVAEKHLDGLFCTLGELSEAKDGDVAELRDEVREHLLQLASACMDLLIFRGQTFVDAWENITNERTRQGSLWAAENDAKLTGEDWYYILKTQHKKAVEHRLAEAVDAPLPDTYLLRMVKLGATAVAALENLDF